MKLVMILGAIMSIVLAAVAIQHPNPPPAPPAPVDERVISSTPCDIDADGSDELIEIAMVDGTLYDREWHSCEAGEIWEGRFDIRVIDSGPILSAVSLNELMGRDSLYFWYPRFELQMGDYNHDGLVDFNLFSSYGQCNGGYFRLFTIDRAGQVSCLGTNEFYAASPSSNSSRCILGKDGLLATCHYTQGDYGNVTNWYDWTGDGWTLLREGEPIGNLCPQCPCTPHGT